MASNQKQPELSAWEYTTLLFAALKTLNHTIITSITAPFRGSKGAKKYSQHVLLSYTRKLTNTASVRHIQAIVPPARDTYLAHAKKHNFKPEWETLPDGGEAYWFGDKTAKKTMIFFHGGGYGIPVTPGHMSFLTHLTTHIPSLRILLPAYTLAPRASYPTQLIQASSALQLLLSPPFSLSPSQITLAGDSAGGNLALAIISHLLHPHPELPAIDLNGEKLAAAVLISPWASFDQMKWPSIRENELKDLIPVARAKDWERNFLGGREKDGWNEAAGAKVPEGWWDELGKVVGEVLVTAGGDEVLVDSIRVLGEQLKEKHDKVTLLVANGEWHENCVQELPKDESKVTRDAITAFMAERV